MSIYENGPSPKSGRGEIKNPLKGNLPPQKVDPKHIMNNRDLTKLVKLMKKGPKTAKEILYDHKKNIVGILQRDDTPFIFTEDQVKEFMRIINGVK